MTDAGGGWLDGDEERVWRSFFESQVVFWRRMARDLQHETGLSEPDFALLSALLRSPDGSLRPYELSEVTDFEKSRLHHHLTRMAGRGLITRTPCPDNARAAIITLTPEGRAAITAAFPKRAAHIRRWLLDPLSAGQRDALAEIADRLHTTLREPEKP
ncbi:MarR family transcriptional regulator [Actinocorallia sp. API 0066]|uniref:MarR family winged helix-turn-helix transcriptional regulator n=1 Tax=Actinocorallia sp. API 0066 TaxID=2896846 RepID=UPI001E2BD8B4|nr:MarR family transcriptional regulator [Actinocorallia sp. API 0066]MCD0451609.1 MarR family transcriptional regulator [Actinocorallia sp. API 0066]